MYSITQYLHLSVQNHMCLAGYFTFLKLASWWVFPDSLPSVERWFGLSIIFPQNYLLYQPIFPCRQISFSCVFVHAHACPLHSTVPLFVFRTSPESQQLKRGLGHLGLEAQTQHTRWQSIGKPEEAKLEQEKERVSWRWERGEGGLGWSACGREKRGNQKKGGGLTLSTHTHPPLSLQSGVGTQKDSKFSSMSPNVSVCA